MCPNSLPIRVARSLAPALTLALLAAAAWPDAPAYADAGRPDRRGGGSWHGSGRGQAHDPGHQGPHESGHGQDRGGHPGTPPHQPGHGGGSHGSSHGAHDWQHKRVYAPHHGWSHGPWHGGSTHHHPGWSGWYGPRYRSYRGIYVYRPYGHCYTGYGWYRHDDDAYKWLAFTAITLKLLDNFNEAQQRQHEAAQVRATTAPVGETIQWSDGFASGAVTATREGTSSTGRYCREFRQEVRIGGRVEQAYGTACRQPDGSWEMVSSGG